MEDSKEPKKRDEGVKDIIIIPVEESEESEDTSDEVEQCSELASEESFGKDPPVEERPVSTRGGKRHGRRSTSALAGSENKNRTRKRRRRKKKAKHTGAGSTKSKGHGKKEGPTDSGGVGTGLSLVKSRENSALYSNSYSNETGTTARVLRVQSAPHSSVFKRIYRREMVASTQIKASNGDTKKQIDNKMGDTEESTVTKLQTSSAKSENTRIGVKAENSSCKSDKPGHSPTFKLTQRPMTASATEISSTYASPLNSGHNVATNKPRSMLLALSKESYQRTLPPVLHTQSMNLALDGNKQQNGINGLHNKQQTLSRLHNDNINTAVMKYANSKGVVLQKEVLSNARVIPIVPQVDNTRPTRSNSFLRDVNYKEKAQAEKEVTKCSHSLYSRSNSEKDIKPILKDNQNGKSFDKRKSVRFQIPEH